MLCQPTPMVDVNDFNERPCMCESCIKARYAHNCYICTGFSCNTKRRGFFPRFSRLWKVVENQFGPGKSWKLKLKVNVLESTGKDHA